MLALLLSKVCASGYDSTLVGTTCPGIRYGYERAVVNESETRECFSPRNLALAVIVVCSSLFTVTARRGGFREKDCRDVVRCYHTTRGGLPFVRVHRVPVPTGDNVASLLTGLTDTAS